MLRNGAHRYLIKPVRIALLQTTRRTETLRDQKTIPCEHSPAPWYLAILLPYYVQKTLARSVVRRPQTTFWGFDYYRSPRTPPPRLRFFLPNQMLQSGRQPSPLPLVDLTTPGTWVLSRAKCRENSERCSSALQLLRPRFPRCASGKGCFYHLHVFAFKKYYKEVSCRTAQHVLHSHSCCINCSPLNDLEYRNTFNTSA